MRLLQHFVKDTSGYTTHARIMGKHDLDLRERVRTVSGPGSESSMSCFERATRIFRAAASLVARIHLREVS